MNRPAQSPAIPSAPTTARLFHALSDETRLAILGMLRRGERCVCDLQEALDSPQSRLSFHLKVLRQAGLVKDRKEGRWSYYSVDPGALGAASEAALAMLPGVDGAPALHQLARGRPGPRAEPTTPPPSAPSDGGEPCCG